jgi:hypothetical protein
MTKAWSALFKNSFYSGINTLKQINLFFGHQSQQVEYSGKLKLKIPVAPQWLTQFTWLFFVILKGPMSHAIKISSTTTIDDTKADKSSAMHIWPILLIKLEKLKFELFAQLRQQWLLVNC